MCTSMSGWWSALATRGLHCRPGIWHFKGPYANTAGGRLAAYWHFFGFRASCASLWSAPKLSSLCVYFFLSRQHPCEFIIACSIFFTIWLGWIGFQGIRTVTWGICCDWMLLVHLHSLCQLRRLEPQCPVLELWLHGPLEQPSGRCEFQSHPKRWTLLRQTLRPPERDGPDTELLCAPPQWVPQLGKFLCQENGRNKRSTR